MDLKGTWTAVDLGLRPPPPGSTPRAATGREAVPANHVRQRWESIVEFFSWCGFYQKRMRKDWLEQDYTYSEDRRALLSEPIRKQVTSSLEPGSANKLALHSPTAANQCA